MIAEMNGKEKNPYRESLMWMANHIRIKEKLGYKNDDFIVNELKKELKELGLI